MKPFFLPAAEKKRPRLRWYQYRLRSLFVLTTLVAIGMSWLPTRGVGTRGRYSSRSA